MTDGRALLPREAIVCTGGAAECQPARMVQLTLYTRAQCPLCHEMRAVIERTLAQPNIRVWENTFTLDLLTYESACRGAIVATRHNEKMLIWARQTILATGGCGQVYRESTNPPVATGDLYVTVGK